MYLQLYLAATPADFPLARKHTGYLAHMAYRIGPDGSLLIAALPPSLRGGLMLLSDRDAGTPQNTLAKQILQECLSRNYAGVVLDSDGPPTLPPEFPAQLESVLLKHRRKLFLPEHYAPTAPHSTVLVCTAISGGHLRQYRFH